MRRLKNVSLIAVDTLNKGAAISALQKSLQQVQPDKCILLTDKVIDIEGIEVIQIPVIKSKDEYSRFMIKELFKYITTDFIITIQHDGYVINGDAFDERLYEFDYAGALWHNETDELRNGNGGYSWRSRILCEIVGKDDTVEILMPEDVSLCRIYRRYLEGKYDLKWAPDELCEGFSYECREPNMPTMGFHGYFFQPYQPTVVLQRSAALGDIVAMEPVMRHFAMNGYNIVLDIPLDSFELFKNHYFPVKHITHFDKGRIPHKVYSLDLSYEVKPRQSYLKSYFEFCGIKNFKLSRPQLYPLVNDVTRLFKKYAVIHIDQRETPHRNVFGVDFKRVKRHLEAYGYLVLQIGKGDHEEVGLEINTSSVGYMKFIIAGADLFLGVDSGPASIAVAHNIPSVLFFGSVESSYIHPDLTNVEIVQQPCIYAGCWHQPGSTTGKECVFNAKKPPCCVHETEQVIEAINKLHNTHRHENI
jgi:ADP-heptose:LPS heptosyltransferase